jgi:predicted DNA repair protein MutK
MAGGLVGLLDDVAALAKLAASSVDDVGAAAGKASMKAAGVVVDDAAVTPGYVKDLAAERELPIIRRIAVGSLRNKVLFILPAALLLSEIAPKVVEVLLMGGGAFLCYEGAHKVIHALRRDDHDHDVPAAVRGPEAEAAVVSGAIRTDFILSAEIMVIALKEVLEEGLAARAAILVIVAVAITAVVYGAVALIVKMDDVGIALIQRGPGRTARLGRLLVTGMPRLLAVLSVVGTAAMLWVGGHLLLASADELGWSWPYDLVHDLEHAVHDVGGVGGVLGWLANTGASAVVGLVVGSLLVGVVSLLPFGKGGHTAH